MDTERNYLEEVKQRENIEKDVSKREFMYSCKEGCLPYVEELVEGDFNPKSSYAYQALVNACSEGHLEIVELLVEKGVEFQRGYPAKFALLNGHVKLAEFLLNKGRKEWYSKEAIFGHISKNDVFSCRDIDVIRFMEDNELVDKDLLDSWYWLCAIVEERVEEEVNRIKKEINKVFEDVILVQPAGKLRKR